MTKRTTKKATTKKKAAKTPAKRGAKRGTKPAKPKPAPAKAKPAKKREGMSGLNAAAKVLADAGQPMTCKQMVEKMLAKGLWTTSGKTPSATIYSAILREINTKGKDSGGSRFVKTERGKFQLQKGV